MITESTDRADLSICKGRKKIIQHIYNYLKLNYKGEIPEMEYLICKKK